MCFSSQRGLGLICICSFIRSSVSFFLHASCYYHAEISDAPLANTNLLIQCFFFFFFFFPGQGWLLCSLFAGDTHRDALVHLQTELCDWLTGGAHRDEDVLFQCGHTGGHERLGQGHEPGCTHANPYCQEVSESTHFTEKLFFSLYSGLAIYLNIF